QGNGIGRLLMQTSAEALRAMKFRELTLTVTSDNAAAVKLYEKLGFITIRTFTAGVWPRSHRHSCLCPLSPCGDASAWPTRWSMRPGPTGKVPWPLFAPT